MTSLRISGFDLQKIDVSAFCPQNTFFRYEYEFSYKISLSIYQIDRSKRLKGSCSNYQVERSEKLKEILVKLSHRAKREAENITLSEARGLRVEKLGDRLTKIPSLRSKW